MGRPRTVSFSDEEFDRLGDEMVAFVLKHKKEILHLSEWYTVEKCYTYNQWKTFIQKEPFIPYYEQALKILAKKYLDKNSNVRDGIAHRWLRVYYKDLRESEDQDADVNELRKAAALKSETRAIEEEKLKILDDVQRNKRTPK